MSTGQECTIVQVRTDAWYYLLSDPTVGGVWDWREFAQAYGPFDTEERARMHVTGHHANPGGYSVDPLPPGLVELDLSQDPVLAARVADAQSPRALRRRW